MDAANAPCRLLQTLLAYVMRNVFSRARKTDRDMSSRSAAGRMFHTVGLLTVKLRSSCVELRVVQRQQSVDDTDRCATRLAYALSVGMRYVSR